MMETALAVIVTIIGSYLLGSVSFGVIFTRLFAGADIRAMGSGNSGMTNVLRSVGTVPGALTGIGDFAKGAASLILGNFAFSGVGLDSYMGSCLAAVFVLLGHLFPLYFRFRGGKGVMTTAGILLLLNPYVLLAEAAVFAGVFAVTRVVSKASVSCAALLPVFNIIYCVVTKNEMLFSTIFMALTGGLIIFTHRENIKRIRAGTESKLVIKRKEETP